MPRNWFEDYEMVIGDEAHLFKAKSLTTIMGHLRNAWLRIGTTGTLDGSKVHKLVLEGAFGPVFNVVSTKKLIESKTLSDISIDVIHMQYSDQEKKSFGKKTYQEEISYIVEHKKRNNFIKNLALSQQGNTLVLFNLVDKHGKPLYNLIRDKADIQKFLTQANETSLALFKKNNDFINEYVETPEMSKKDKLKDIELMIEHFVEEERYEDCALLVKVKNKVIKFYEKPLTKKQL